MRNIIGGIGFIIFIVGLSFKMQHWPGSSILFLTGTLLSIVYFLIPKKSKVKDTDILDHETNEGPEEEEEIPKSRKIGDIFRSLGISIILVAVFFNIQQYPYSGYILWSGVLITGTGVFILYKP